VKRIKLTEDHIERLVKKIIKEENGMSEYEKSVSTISGLIAKEISGNDSELYMKSIRKIENWFMNNTERMENIGREAGEYLGWDKTSINELDKETYYSASEKARERGMSGLADKFKSHGQEFGKSNEKVVNTWDGSISFTYMGRHENDVIDVTNIEWYGDKRFYGFVNRHKYPFYISVEDNNITTMWGGDSRVYPSTVSDARKYLKLLNDNGVDTGNIRPKQITVGYF
jgi:hypothetical protein